MELFNLQPLAEHINSFIEFMGLRKIEEKQKLLADYKRFMLQFLCCMMWLRNSRFS